MKKLISIMIGSAFRMMLIVMLLIAGFSTGNAQNQMKTWYMDGQSITPPLVF